MRCFMWAINVLFVLHEFLVVESLDSRSPSEMLLLPHLYKVFRWNKISYKFYLTDFTAKRKTSFFMFLMEVKRKHELKMGLSIIL